MLILTQDGRSVKVAPQSFTNEDTLQRYVSANPGAIPLSGAAGDRELHVLGREFATESGPIDVLATDVNGHPYIIETKLHKNPDKRTVVAQVLDYGAALWATPPSARELVERLRAGAARRNAPDPLPELASFLDSDETAANDHIERFSQSLAKGQFTAIILMDHLSKGLKDLILFINANSRFRCWAVELEYYRHGDTEIAYPRLFGAESRAVGADSPGNPSPSPEQYLSKYATRCGPDAVEHWRTFVEAAQAVPGVQLSHLPAGTPYIYLADTPVGDIRLFRLSDNVAEIRDLLHQAKTLAERPELLDARTQLRDALVSRVPGAAVRGSAGRVYIPLAAAALDARLIVEEVERLDAILRRVVVDVATRSGLRK
jgi:hypothetical protein